MSFGRKQVGTPTPPPPPSGGSGGGGSENPKDHPGHQAVLRLLREKDATEPEARLQLAGRVVFDLFCRMLQGERGVRIEDLLAALGSIGGHLCLTAILDSLKTSGRTPQDIGMLVADGADGHSYYFGDAPNRLLLESQFSLLSLTLGAAHHLGAPVTLEMVHDVMKRTASSVASPAFAQLSVPEKHQPALTPFQWVEHGRQRMIEAFDLYEVAPEGRPSAVGFAIQQAIDAGKAALDPLTAARIVIECAVPMAKVDPARFC